jgi:hypothetical protein
LASFCLGRQYNAFFFNAFFGNGDITKDKLNIIKFRMALLLRLKGKDFKFY